MTKRARPVHFDSAVPVYTDPLTLTLQWFQTMLADDDIAAEAATDDEFGFLFATGRRALAAGERLAAELAIERALELFANIQNRAFIRKRLRGAAQTTPSQNRETVNHGTSTVDRF